MTASFISPGCLPDSRHYLADPYTVCAASFKAISRGRPILTPPSAIASISKKMYAGPLPLTPVTASSYFSVTSYDNPTEFINNSTVSASYFVAFDPKLKPDAPAPTLLGVFGITRTSLLLLPRCYSIYLIEYPAAIDTIR